jgi:hypothetical protein
MMIALQMPDGTPVTLQAGDEIYVRTPKGKVIWLAQFSREIDGEKVVFHNRQGREDTMIECEGEFDLGYFSFELEVLTIRGVEFLRDSLARDEIWFVLR